MSQNNPIDAYVNAYRGDIDFCSCDYLGLACHPQLNQMDAEALLKYGRINYSRSAAYPRNMQSPVWKFERMAARWLNAEDTMLVNSGTEANVDVLQLALIDSDMPVYMDKYAHYTFVFGARAAGRMDMFYFKHNDADDLLKLVRQYGPGVVCIDTVYSALGTVAPIEKIVDICNSNGCILIADEAHALGTIGYEGEGLVKSRGLEKYVQFRTTSLSKSFGAGGGLVAFSEEVAEGKSLIYHIGTFPIFSLAPQDSLAERLINTLDLIIHDTWRRDELQQKTRMFQDGCLSLGYQGVFVKNASTNIIPFVVGPVDIAKDVYDMFVSNHIYPSPHFYPASPRNKSIIRFTVCNSLTYEQIEVTLQFMKGMYVDVHPWDWADTKDNVFNIGFQIV